MWSSHQAKYVLLRSRGRGNTGNGETATCPVAIVMLVGQSGAGQRAHGGHSGGRMCSISRLQRVLSLHLPGGLHFDPPGSTLLLLLVCHQSHLPVVRNGVLCIGDLGGARWKSWWRRICLVSSSDSFTLSLVEMLIAASHSLQSWC